MLGISGYGVKREQKEITMIIYIIMYHSMYGIGGILILAMPQFVLNEKTRQEISRLSMRISKKC